MRNKWIIAAVAVFATAGGGLAFVSAQDEAAQTAVVQADHQQPIAFPHNVHADTYQIDCQYCHYSADRSVDAGIPPVSTCLGCHTAIRGQTEQAQAEIQKIHDYASEGETIPWVRIHKVADHVKFPHSRHINAGLSCQTCHGEVQNLGVFVEPDPAWGKGKMGWCISCHVENEVSRDCTVCHY